MKHAAFHIVFEKWIGDIVNWDSTKRPTTEQLGERFWELLSLLVEIPDPIRGSWEKINFLCATKLLSTDLPSNNLAMNQESPPRRDQFLLEGAPNYHVGRLESVAAARENILGSSHDPQQRSGCEFQSSMRRRYKTQKKTQSEQLMIKGAST